MANRIREIRQSRKLSLQQVADQVGTTRTQIMRLETGVRRLTDTWMYRLGRVLDCHPAEFLENSAPGYPPKDPLAEELVIRAVEEILTYVKEERLDLDPEEVAGSVIELYRQYEEIARRPPAVNLGGNVVKFPAERRRRRAVKEGL